jgi:hypothetical protein
MLIKLTKDVYLKEKIKMNEELQRKIDESFKEMLDLSMGKHISEVEYCEWCGKKLIKEKNEIGHFIENGDPAYEYVAKCPSRKFYRFWHTKKRFNHNGREIMFEWND